MDLLLLFIKEFVVKNKQERLSHFAKSNWDRFATELDKLEICLNEKCICINSNIVNEFNKIVSHKNIKSGIYFDSYSKGNEMFPVDFSKIHDSSLLICPRERIAFFFHHEGWMWICDSG